MKKLVTELTRITCNICSISIKFYEFEECKLYCIMKLNEIENLGIIIEYICI